MLALTSPTGKLGGAVLNAILEHNLIDKKDLVVCTSSDLSSPSLAPLHAHSLTIRHASYTDPASLAAAYTGCTSLFLVSTPAIHLDYSNAPLWSGREAHHRAAIDAALAAGVKHIYYTSLGFSASSAAGVMRAHLRTEDYLASLQAAAKVDVTVLREGLYSKSWPLYFGYYYGLSKDPRKEVLVAGDGPVAWTCIADLGLATARVLAAPAEKWKGRTVYLAQREMRTLRDVAALVSRSKKEDVRLRVVSKGEYEEYYVKEMGMQREAVEWWSSTYESLEKGECAVQDPVLEELLAEVGRKPVPFEETFREMMK